MNVGSIVSVNGMCFCVKEKLGDRIYLCANQNSIDEYVMKTPCHEYEINNINLLKKNTVKLPIIYTTQNSIIMEKLDSLDTTEDINEIKNQLFAIIHQIKDIGVLTDIKPQNIMKKKNSERVEYYFIDYASLSTIIDKQINGVEYYRPFERSLQWMSTSFITESVCYKHMMYEVLYVISAIMYAKKSHDRCMENYLPRIHKHKKLIQFFEEVNSV